MGLIRDRHGTYCARKRVPKGLEAVVAQVLANGKPTQTWLKKSLGTKSPQEAKLRGKPVLIEFDHTIERARDLLKQRPTRKSLSPTEIDRIVEYHYATMLGNDAAVRREGRQVIDKFRSGAPHIGVPSSGLTDDEFERIGKAYEGELKSAQTALARGNIEYIAPVLDELLEIFSIRLDPTTAAYRSVGTAVLTADVKALQAVQRRHAGEPVETPRQPDITETGTPEGDTLRAAFQGWQKARNPSSGTLAEYERAIRLFTELHGDKPVVDIKRSHARQFREALQEVPRLRQGDLLKASLPELAEWGRKHPDAARLSRGTINKLLGGVQAIAVWARDQGLIPDDVPWSDPFARMRLEEDEPDREPFTVAELKLMFGSPVFTQGERPRGGRGEAAFWLPLLGLFTGARRGELAGLLVGQRVFGIALGYEDLNDHDELRHDPIMAVLAGKLEAKRDECAPVAGKSTLNRLELSRLEATRYHKISHNPIATKRLMVDLFLDAHRACAARDRPRSGCDRRSGARGAGGALLPRLLRLLLLSAAVRVLRAPFVGGQAASGEPGCGGGGGGGSGADRCADSGSMAECAHHVCGPTVVLRGRS